MINLFYGNKIESCTNAIIASLKDKDQGCFSVIIAPDSYVFSIENQVAMLGYSLDVEVMSFTRLAKAILKNSINRCLTPEGCTMIMTRAIHSCKDKLEYYKKSLTRKGFVNEMYSTITALRNSGIGVNELKNATSAMHGYVANKTKDLATIYNAYLDTLTKEYSDPTTRLEALTKQICNSDFVKETQFYIVDFYTFNKKEYDVLSELFKYAYSVSIGIVDCVGGLSPKSIYPYDNKEMILSLAKESGAMVVRTNCYDALDEFERFISNDLFGINLATDVKTDMPIELITPQTPADEADNVCIKIAELVRSGVRYKDIGIIQGNPNDTTLQTYLQDYDIPYFVDSKIPITEEPAIKYLLIALECASSNLDCEKVMSLVKNPLSMIKPKDAMFFENYCDKFAIDRSIFLSEFSLGKEQEIEIPERVRKNLLKQIPELKKQSTVGEYVNVIKQYLKDVDFQKRLNNFFEKQIANADIANAKRTAQVPLKLVPTLNLCQQLLDDYTIDLKDFLDLLQSSFESIKLSLIPVSADCVQIGESRDCKFEDIKYLFVVGAEDGKVPMESGQGTILTNKYHQDLQLYNMVVRPQVKEENRFGKFCFSQLLLKASKGLYISCSKTSSSGEKINKSEIFDKFQSSLGLAIKDSFIVNEYSRYVTEKQCLDKLSRAISVCNGELDDFHKGLLSLLTSEDFDKIMNLYYDRDNELLNGQVFVDSQKTTTVSKIESFYVCPYSFFIRYGLKAQERPVAAVQVNETGSFIHEVLDIYFTENTAALESISYAAAKELALEICNRVLQNDERLKGIAASDPRKIDNLKSETAIIVGYLTELVKQGSFRPYLTEVKFGLDDDCIYPPIELSSGTKVRGMIDRIDRAGNNIVVIDYKTGKVKPELKQVFYGEKVQLYIYLYALKTLGFRPVGAFYQHLDAGFTSDKGVGAFAYKGQFVATDEIIKLFDDSFFSNESSWVLPIKIKTTKGKKELTTTTDAKASDTLLSEEQLHYIIEYSKKLLEKADGLISNGYIDAKPIEGKCKYCLAKNICKLNDNSYRKTISIEVDDFNLTKDEKVD